MFVAGVYATLYAHWIDDPNWVLSEVAVPTVTEENKATFRFFKVVVELP